MTALTSDIAKFVASISARAVPERCNFGARIGMLDCVGTMIAGADEEAVRLVAQIVPAYTGNDGAPEIPGRAQPVGFRCRARQRCSGARSRL
jgi:2-methylcitrate dehydratase PrpD